MREAITWAVTAYDLIVIVYLVTLNTLYLAFAGVALWRLVQQRYRWTPRHLDAVMRSPATPGVSIVAPAYNEELTIRESLRSLMALHYPDFEVIVVNDGSRDGTLAALIDGFGLVRAPVDHQGRIGTQPVRGIYRSLSHQDLVVVDKVNGGKADAVNAGINAARHPLVCIIDVDTLFEEDALTRVVLPFLEDPSTVAAGGLVRIVNGCEIDAGRVTRVRLPGNLLAAFQVVEYLRAFLSGRVAMSAFNALLVISGAFGVFRRDVLVDVGGLRHDTIGEDMELVTRLHRHCRDRGMRYRIVYQPDPVCWTEAPETLRVLGSQRNRWQRGTLQVLSYHWEMCGRARYGAVGLFAMPYYLIFEALGPILEISGYAVTIVALALGLLDWRVAQLLFVAAVIYGALISLVSVLLEEVSFRRYARLRDLLLLAGLGVLENFGYRQLTTWWRFRGLIDFFRNKQGWGTMTRKGFLPKQV